MIIPGFCDVHYRYTLGPQVHYGMVLPSGSRQEPPVGYLPWGGPIDEQCAVWLHLVNLFTGRDNRTTHEEDTRWHWVFDRLGQGRREGGAGLST